MTQQRPNVSPQQASQPQDAPVGVPTAADDETSLMHMLKLAGPMIVITVSFTIMETVDRLMVSRVGTDAFAAIVPAGFVAFVAGGFAMGTMAALNALVSQSLGAGRLRDCSSYYWQMLYMGAAFFAVVVVVTFPAAPLVFRWMRQPPEIIPLEVTYFRILLFAHLPAVINWASGQFYAGIHRPSLVLLPSLVGQAVNVAANYVLIFGKFGAPRLGLAGAAWGTFIGIVAGAVINLAILFGSEMRERFDSRRTLGIDVAKMKDLLRVGLPAGVALTVSVPCWMIILFAFVGRFGTDALAATNAVLSCTNVSVMPVVGMGMALTAAVGKSVGAGRKDMAIRQTTICIRVAIVYMGLVGAGCFIFREPLMRFWSKEPAVIAAGTQIIICAAIYQVFHAARTVYSAALRATGDTLWLAYISAVGALLILGLGGYLTVRLLPGLGYMGPWIAAGVSIAVVGLSNWLRFRSNRWMEIDLFRERVPPVTPDPPAAAVE
ncbi:MAG TPA: MATE family efflux transporter [Phycisphaerales bacterium]|nr:MATE family efflux transporter [Phycisphaerales bacterium]